MTLVVVLFVAGLLLLACEVIVPGAILGIMGGIALLAGVVVAFQEFGFDGGMIATGIALLMGAIMFYLEFVLLPKSRLAKALSMTATVEGTSQPAVADRSVIGKRVVAVTALSPSGVVECEGRRFEAFARNGFVARGEELDVVELDNFRLVVSKPSTVAKQ